jgi:ribosomal protein L34E
MDLTVKQFAKREQVTSRQVRRWIDKGAIEVRRTPGGGIRIVERRRERATATTCACCGHPMTSLPVVPSPADGDR